MDDTLIIGSNIMDYELRRKIIDSYASGNSMSSAATSLDLDFEVVEGVINEHIQTLPELEDLCRDKLRVLVNDAPERKYLVEALNIAAKFIVKGTNDASQFNSQVAPPINIEAV